MIGTTVSIKNEKNLNCNSDKKDIRTVVIIMIVVMIMFIMIMLLLMMMSMTMMMMMMMIMIRAGVVVIVPIIRVSFILCNTIRIMQKSFLHETVEHEIIKGTHFFYRN